MLESEILSLASSNLSTIAATSIFEKSLFSKEISKSRTTANNLWISSLIITISPSCLALVGTIITGSSTSSKLTIILLTVEYSTSESVKSSSLSIITIEFSKLLIVKTGAFSSSVVGVTTSVGLFKAYSLAWYIIKINFANSPCLKSPLWSIAQFFQLSSLPSPSVFNSEGRTIGNDSSPSPNEEITVLNNFITTCDLVKYITSS